MVVRALAADGLACEFTHAVTRKEFEDALARTREERRTTVIVAEVEKEVRVPGYESWWDVPVAEVSEMETVQAARDKYEDAVKAERFFV